MDDHPFAKLAPIRFSEQIASRIESLILEGRFRLGERLPSERELATSFGVSRPVVRESIKLLEERGLLESRNGRGAFVTTPGHRGIASSLNIAFQMQDCTSSELHEARWYLESLTATLAAQRATEEDIARMEAAVAVMDANVDNPEGFLRADVEFHASLATATHNPLFQAMSQPLVALLLNIGPKGFSYGHVMERHEYHRQLVEQIKRRDAAGAQAAMQQHLTLSKQALS